jgi:hypothetical protein
MYSVSVVSVIRRKFKVCRKSWVPVAHAYNPSYSGGRHQEDPSPKPVHTKSSQDPTQKKPFTKKGLVEWLQV